MLANVDRAAAEVAEGVSAAVAGVGAAVAPSVTPVVAADTLLASALPVTLANVIRR